MDKLIITVAGVGAETTKDAQPGLPVTAAEIGADAARCREAGAAMYHLHVRDAEANPTQAKEVFAAAIEAIRERTDIIIQTSTGGAMGMTADERLQPLELGPEMASLTTGTANFGDDVFFNDSALMSEFYQRMQKKGVRPEFEIFEAGQIDNALKLVKKYGPAGPLLHWDFVLGVPGSMSGEPRNLVFLVDRIPEGSTWTCTGIGRWHMPVTMTALALGGNVRLGFEDNIFLHKGVLAKENAELVGRITKPVESAPKLNLTRSMAMLEDAQRLTPGGVGGIRRPYNFVVGEYPVFITHGHGGHIVDVDGNEYIDMLCAYGPIILGYVEDEINDAAKAQMDKGFCFSLVQPLQNELEQRLADIMPCGEQTILVKTGSDATNAAVRAMRAYTGRDKIARCGYHGWGDWCVEHHGGVPRPCPSSPRSSSTATSPSSSACSPRTRARSPASSSPRSATRWPSRSSRRRTATCRRSSTSAHKHGAVVTFDEIRTGFRVSMGGASERYGVTPDLTTVGKAMANGYSIAALVGRREVMGVYVKDAFLSSTYFPNSLEMAASMKCLEILEREKVQDVIWERGTRFLASLGEIVDKSGVPVTKSGIPPMPFLTFDHVDDHYKERRTEFYTQCIRRGLFVQPYHHWYICYRHTEHDLNRALEVIEESLAFVHQQFPYSK